MIGRRTPREVEDQTADVKLKGFDDFELSLGDIMRGERATMGKSLLDVQRELRIKASYIAAIENSDPSAFDTPGFIAGYVRSYARYLNMDPDLTFAQFCKEADFAVAHGMSSKASVMRKPEESGGPARAAGGDPFAAPKLAFAPESDGIFAELDLRALGSALVLVLLIGGIGYGGWSVLREVQQVQVAPVEQTPLVLSDLDPLESAVRSQTPGVGDAPDAPSIEALDRLYRPQALDVPVLVARDAPISTLDPRTVGTLRAPELPQTGAPDTGIASRRLSGPGDTLSPAIAANETTFPRPGPNVPQVVETPGPALQMVAVRETWVRVRSADGTTIYEATMRPGDTWEAPLTEEPPTLRTGNSGGIYFAMSGKFYGPVGPKGAITSNLPLSVASLQETYLPVEIGSDEGLVRYAEAQGLLTGRGN